MKASEFISAILALLAIAASPLQAATLCKGETDIVVASKAVDSVKFAGEELQKVLSEVLGEEVPIVGKPDKGRIAVILGANKWSREAGLDTTGFGRDTFVIRSETNRVFILGYDDKGDGCRSAIKKINVCNQRCGTLFGVYAFLESYAGVRFYFPGELGTIVPKAESVSVPVGEKKISPTYDIREWYEGPEMCWLGSQAPDEVAKRNINLNWLRLRMGTHRIPLCHGTNKFKYLERFGESHPEYFALKANGSRHNVPGVKHPGHFCWNSPIVEEIYQDVKCALTGGKPADRGIPEHKWGRNVDTKNKFVDIMPQDAQPDCMCEKCTEQRKRGENVVWVATAKIASRLKEEGVEGTVTQMAYGRNRAVPEFELPTNIAIQVAVGGAWSMNNSEIRDNERKIVESWVKKLGHKVWLWNYMCKSGKMRTLIGIPQLSMREWGAYYKSMPDLIVGAFAESGTERFSFNYLNWYVYSRVCWDASVDVESILEEHFRLMYGAAANEMAAYYGVLEEKWTKQIVGTTRNTPLGPERIVPSHEVVFTQIYSKDELAKLDALISTALSKVKTDSLEARRIRLFSEEYVGSIRNASRAYYDRLAAVDSYRVKASATEAIALRPIVLGKKKDRKVSHPVACSVTTWRDAEALHYRFVCNEPLPERIVDMKRPNDDPEIWKDNGVELHLCPTGDRKDVCHVMLNSQGSVATQRYAVLGTSGRNTDDSWGKSVRTAVAREANSWTAEIVIPLAEFKKLVTAVPTSFARSRIVADKKGTSYYVWGPGTIEAFGDSSNFGTVEY